jgi:tRNA 2-thiocytidine biosynthesis protein TtcA
VGLPIAAATAPCCGAVTEPVRRRDDAKALATLRRRLLRKVGQAIADHEMISDGDRILVAVSGGKDSYALLDLLSQLRARAPVRFDLVAINVDASFRGYRTDLIAKYLAGEGYEHAIVREDIDGILREHRDPDTLDCALCSRVRRGVLYRVARERGCTKVALGHHRDDLIETLLLNLFFNGRIKSMSPKLRADDGVNVVIRPLCYVPEEDLRLYAGLKAFPIVCCNCPACTSGPGEAAARDQQRQAVKRLLGELESKHPGIKQSLLASLGRVDTRHLMAGKRASSV